VRYRATVGSLRSTLLAELPLQNQKFMFMLDCGNVCKPGVAKRTFFCSLLRRVGLGARQRKSP
jgi:hypothetical protein